jgi:hypothetical protein
MIQLDPLTDESIIMEQTDVDSWETPTESIVLDEHITTYSTDWTTSGDTIITTAPQNVN